MNTPKSDIIFQPKGVASGVISSPVVRPHVLVVDDDEPTRTVCARMLERANFDADAVPDGSVAWDVLQAAKYDLVVSDCDMPRLSGIDLLKKMRTTGMMEPVILMSGSLKNLSAVDPASFGPLEIVAKPFSFYQLMVTVDALMPFAEVSTRRISAARTVFDA